MPAGWYRRVREVMMMSSELPSTSGICLVLTNTAALLLSCWTEVFPRRTLNEVPRNNIIGSYRDASATRQYPCSRAGSKRCEVHAHGRCESSQVLTLSTLHCIDRARAKRDPRANGGGQTVTSLVADDSSWWRSVRLCGQDHQFACGPPGDRPSRSKPKG